MEPWRCAIAALLLASAAFCQTSHLQFHLPSGTLQAEEIRRRTSSLDGTLLWHGRLTGPEPGSVVLAISAGHTSGSISMDDGRYFQIAQSAPGVFTASEVKAATGQWGGDQIALQGKPLQRNAEQDPRSAPGDTVVDLMVVYSIAAKNAVGGTAAIQNKIQLAVAEANQGFLNSGIALELRLVHTMEQDLDDSAGTNSNLIAVSAFTTSIQTARDQYGADLVSVWIHGGAGNGVAFQMSTVSPTFASQAYSVVQQSQAAGPFFGMAHEIGHNMGADHDRANSSGMGVYSYSFGYRKDTGGDPYFRTIMAYGCSNVNCPAVNYWSNPEVSYQGFSTGVASNQANAADNRQTLNNTKATVAVFRASKSCDYVFQTSQATHPAAGGSGATTITVNAGCSWTATANAPWITLTYGAAGSGSGTTGYSLATNSGATQRTGTITVAGQTFTIIQYGAQDIGNVTIQTVPPGLQITVDGQTYTSPQTFPWPAASTHTIAASSPQGANGTRHLFLGWSDLGAASHTVTVPLSPSNITASYQRQFLLLTAASPAQAGPVETIPSNEDGYYNEGQFVQVRGVSSGAWSFSNWSGDLSGVTNPQQLQMSGPRSVTGHFTSLGTAVTVNTSPPGLKVTIDGNEYTAAQTFVWAPGSTHTIGANAIVSETASNRLAFNGWSDGGAITHPVTTPAGAITYTVSYKTQYRLTTSVSPLGAGSVSVNPQAADGFYDVGTNVQFSASATAAGFSFFNWSGHLGGAANPASLVMNAAKSVIANYAGASNCAYSIGSTEASVGSAGDLLQVPVQTGTGCAYGAASNAPWILVTSGASAANSGVARLSVSPNTGPPRTGTASIAGKTFTVTQAAGGCLFTLTGPSGFLPVTGGDFQLQVSTTANCQWTVQKTASWVTLTGVASGIGNGVVNFQIPANFGPGPRTANIVIGGQWQHLIQRGANLALPYADVPLTELFFDYLALLKSKNVPDLCGVNLVCPGIPILRSSMAVFLVRTLVGDLFTHSPTPYFTDVPANHPQFAYIQKLRELGVTNGCTATTYCPDGAVTRAEMAAFVVRARLGISATQVFPFPAGNFFTDVPINHWAYHYIQKLRELGITLGCTASTYCPNFSNSRGQMGAFMVRGFF